MQTHTSSTRAGWHPSRLRATLITFLALTMLVALVPPPSTSAQEPETVEVKLLATNDFHGRIGQSSYDAEGARTGYPSSAYLSTIFKTIKAEHDNTLHVDAGDLVGATPVLSNLFYDEPTVEVMNEIGLDVQTVGNHEFDRGQDEILRRAEGGCLDGDCDYRGGEEFPGQDFVTLSTNVTTGPSLSDDTLMPPYAIYEMDGASIGFLGVTTVDTPTVVHPSGIQGLTFHPEAAAVNHYVPELQAAGVDAIVVLMHEGGRQDGGPNDCDNFRGAAANFVADFDDAVDVVVSGHTHQAYVCNGPGGPLLTSAADYGRMFTEIDLTIVPGVGVIERSAENHLVSAVITAENIQPDPAVTAIVDHFEELAGPALAEVIGTSTVHIPRTTRAAESAQGNLATDALRDQLPDIDFAFQNSGGLRAPLTDPDDMDGELFNIRREHVLEVWPFGNVAVAAEVSGTQLQAILDNGVREVGGGRFIQLSGMRIEYYIDESVDPADNGGFPRGVIATVEYWDHPDHADGTPVDLSPGATYNIAMNDFMSVGGDGYPDIREDVYSLAESLELVIEQYITENSPVSPAVEGRIVNLGPIVPPSPDVAVGPAIVRGNTWYLREELSNGPADHVFRYGRATDTPLMCDWNGDGTSTPGVFRDGQWFLRNSNDAGDADVVFRYGRPGDHPVCGDWSGDGTATIGVVRGGHWFLRESNDAGPASVAPFAYGRAGDIPVVGDWNGGGIDKIGVVRDGRWLLRLTPTAGDAEIAFAYGRATDVPVVGDWNANGTDGVGVTRGALWLLRMTPSAGFEQASFGYGRSGDVPLTWQP